MKQLSRLYIAAPIARDYKRRKEASLVSAQVLRGFPNGGYQDVSINTAALMMADALRRSTTLAAQHTSGELTAYRGLILQLERRFKDIRRSEAEQVLNRDLTHIFSIWAGESRE